MELVGYSIQRYSRESQVGVVAWAVVGNRSFRKTDASVNSADLAMNGLGNHRVRVSGRVCLGGKVQ